MFDECMNVRPYIYDPSVDDKYSDLEISNSYIEGYVDENGIIDLLKNKIN